MFEIQSRGAEVTQHMNVRGQNEGDDVKTAVDVMLKGIALTPAETNELLKDPDAYERLFRKMNDSDVLDPVFKSVRSFPIAYKVESARVEIDAGHGKPIILADCSLARLSITTGDCGKVNLQVQIQCVPNIDSAGGRLLKLIGANVHVSIRVQNEQQDMLDGDKAQPKADAPRRGRKAKAANGSNGAPLAGRRKRKAASNPESPSAA